MNYRLPIVLLASMMILTRVSAQDSIMTVVDGPKRIPPQIDIIPPVRAPLFRKPNYSTFITRTNRSQSDSPAEILVTSPQFSSVSRSDPGSVLPLLDQLPGLQLQTTTATPNGSVLRIRGLNGRYTQLMRDGFPVYGGLAGSFDFSQISPLDLQQIEILKGPASTLYGGGAAAGAVNLVSKIPWRMEKIPALVNFSSLGAMDAGIYRPVKLKDNLFLSAMLGTHLQLPRDLDGDGASDLPKAQRLFFNPQLGWYTKSRLRIRAGGTLTYDHRNGGDLGLVSGNAIPTTMSYFDRQRMSRWSTQFEAMQGLGKHFELSLRNSQSQFFRKGTTWEFGGSPVREFGGRQFNSYSELALSHTAERNTFQGGLNFNLENFREDFNPDPTRLRDQDYRTFAAFLVDYLDLSYFVALEAGIRAEYVMAQSRAGENAGQLFVLPRMFGLFHLSRRLKARVGGSSGYRMPSLFSEESEALGFRGVQPINFSTVRPEKTLGAEASLNYSIAREYEPFYFWASVQGFYTRITDLVLLQPLGFATPEFLNYDATAITRGLEADFRIDLFRTTLSASYAFTDTYLQDGSSATTGLVLVPRHAIKGSLTYKTLSEGWTFSVNGNWRSSQWLYGGLQSRSLLLLGGTVERDLQRMTLFLNASNLLNARQSRFESMLGPPYQTPQFTQVWAPLDGIYANVGARFKF